MCKQKTINRDELFEILKVLGESFPSKKADYLFLKSNQDGDTNIDAHEFAQMYLKEEHNKQKHARSVTEYLLKLTRKQGGLCNCIRRLFKPPKDTVI